MRNLVAVQGFTGEAGGTVWWTLRGSVRLAALQDAWHRAGLNPAWLPELPSTEKRLGRAVERVASPSAKSDRVLARPIARSGHWALVAESVQGSDANATVVHSTSLTVRVVKGLIEYSDPWHPLASQVAAEFNAQDGLLDRDDLAIWLVDLLRGRLYGTRLRPRGAPYYLLPAHLGVWRQVCDAVGAADAGDCYTLPTLQGQEATRAVLDALVRDVNDDADDYSAAVTGGKVGPRGLRARVNDCDALLERIAQYEGLLGGALEGIRARVQSVQDAAMVAALQAEAAATAE